ncbi:hypothetical protein LJR090_001216 [Bosea sp. LjRoot90]|uniref:hypothetical protein n=1 Tax=Bosea sp. LjRoot90 TaxID=3342342 RepID=UPI003ED0C86A
MHDLDLAARFCDRIIVMNSGTVAADGEALAVIAGAALGETFRVRFQQTVLASDADWVISSRQGGS